MKRTGYKVKSVVRRQLSSFEHARTNAHTACNMLGKLRKKEKKLPPHSYKLGQINNCDWDRQDKTWQECTVLYYSVYCCSFTVLSHTAFMPGKALMMILFTREIWLFPKWMNERGRGREGDSWRYPRVCDLTLSGLMVELILRLNSYVTRLTWPDSSHTHTGPRWMYTHLKDARRPLLMIIYHFHTKISKYTQVF